MAYLLNQSGPPAGMATSASQSGDGFGGRTNNPPEFQLPYTEYAINCQNGRVNFSAAVAGGAGTGTGPLAVSGFDYKTAPEPNFVGDMLRGNLNPSEVALAFFTVRNVALIQEAIRRDVYMRSGPKKYVIDDQDIDELKMIMRGIYYQYAKNNLFDVEGQVRELNKLVIDWSAPRILSEIDHYNYYLNDISHLPVPMTQPMSMSSAGTKSLPFQPMM